jgi:predicted metalloprotease
MKRGTQFGDAWVYFIIAHEWGHAIQFRLHASLTQAVPSELQADCFAGAELYGATRDRTLIFEQGDEKEIVNGITFAADQTPWTSGADHGSALERVQAFALGKNGGMNACLPIA